MSSCTLNDSFQCLASSFLTDRWESFHGEFSGNIFQYFKKQLSYFLLKNLFITFILSSIKNRIFIYEKIVWHTYKQKRENNDSESH